MRKRCKGGTYHIFNIAVTIQGSICKDFGDLISRGRGVMARRPLESTERQTCIPSATSQFLRKINGKKQISGQGTTHPVSLVTENNP